MISWVAAARSSKVKETSQEFTVPIASYQHSERDAHSQAWMCKKCHSCLSPLCWSWCQAPSCCVAGNSTLFMFRTGSQSYLKVLGGLCFKGLWSCPSLRPPSGPASPQSLEVKHIPPGTALLPLPTGWPNAVLGGSPHEPLHLLTPSNPTRDEQTCQERKALQGLFFSALLWPFLE